MGKLCENKIYRVMTRKDGDLKAIASRSFGRNLKEALVNTLPRKYRSYDFIPQWGSFNKEQFLHTWIAGTSYWVYDSFNEQYFWKQPWTS